MSVRIAAIYPRSNRTDIKNTRPGRGYDFRRLYGHATFTLITSVDPPIMRFWQPYVDITISRQDAALLISETRHYRNDPSEHRYKIVPITGGIKASDIKRWRDANTSG